MLLSLLLACPDGEDPAKTVTAPTGAELVDDTVPTLLSTTECGACGGDCVVEELSYAERYHTDEPVAYAVVPPAGGPHNPCWSTWGVHDEPVADDNWVHNLEHGGVVFLHQCTDCTAEVDGMIALATGLGDFTLVTRYPEMDPGFAVVAWGWRLTMGCFDPATAEAFFDAHVDQAPESTTSGPADGCM